METKFEQYRQAFTDKKEWEAYCRDKSKASGCKTFCDELLSKFREYTQMPGCAEEVVIVALLRTNAKYHQRFDLYRAATKVLEQTMENYAALVKDWPKFMLGMSLFERDVVQLLEEGLLTKVVIVELELAKKNRMSQVVRQPAGFR